QRRPAGPKRRIPPTAIERPDATLIPIRQVPRSSHSSANVPRRINRRCESRMPPWSLHPQLETDTWVIGDLELSRLLLMKDANYPWLVLVPQRDGARDLIDLTETDRIQLTKETDRVARAL